MGKRHLKDKVEHVHNVVAPNSFRLGKARKLVKKVVKEYEDVGAIYMSGSTASRRSMQDSSINLVFLHNTSGPEFKKRKKRIMQLAEELGPVGTPKDGKKWYFSMRHAEAAKVSEAEGILQPEMELLSGRDFAGSHGLPLGLESIEKKKSYDKPKQADAKGERATNPFARKRTIKGLRERLTIEKRRKSKQ